MTMTYIWDNGEFHSDHTIYFVESACPTEAVLALMTAGKGLLLAVVKDIEWYARQKADTVPLTEWFASNRYTILGEVRSTARTSDVRWIVRLHAAVDALAPELTPRQVFDLREATDPFAPPR